MITQEMLGVREMMIEFGLALELPMQLLVDNQAAISRLLAKRRR